MKRPTLITPEFLRTMPLPRPAVEGDKEARGRVLVVGGGRETPGAVVLAGTAALRAGAGKLQVATGASHAAHIASSLPEARVFALPETRAGNLSKAACAKLEEHLRQSQCVCIGPGMIEDEAVTRFVEAMLRMCRDIPVVLDAGAVACLKDGRDLLHALGGRAIVTPNADELAEMYGDEGAEREGALVAARRAAAEFRAVVVLKGRETFVATPVGVTFVNRAGSVGLATSGSGDVLAGIIAGLVARGTESAPAAAWAVYLHARAGERLARKVGPLGFLARELPAEIPQLMAELSLRD